MMTKLFKTSQQYDDWQQNNCRRCWKRSDCEIRHSIYVAALSDKYELPLKAIQRLGENFQVNGCNEFEIDGDAIAKAAKKQKRQELIAQIVTVLAEFENVKLDPKIIGLIIHGKVDGYLPKGNPEMGRWVKIATKIVEYLEKNEHT
jgi:hypothetical protein